METPTMSLNNRRFILFSIIFFSLLFTLNAKGDGMIVIPEMPRIIDPPPSIRRGFPLVVSYHDVSVTIKNHVARTKIDQEFYNPLNQQLEGYYLFPVPEKAIIQDFAMSINGKKVHAELLDAKKAQEIYETLLRKMIDPALLEYYKNGLFKVRIFPIAPKERKKVSLSYFQVLKRENNTYSYRYPLNTEKFSAKPLKSVSIQVRLNTSQALKNIYCTSHQAEVIKKNSRKAIISYEANEVLPDRDFMLFYTTNRSKFGVSLISYQKKYEKGFFYLNIAPNIAFDKDDIDHKDITFIVDTSGSMDGSKLAKAKKALQFCINHLNANDHFEIIRFSTDVTPLFQELKPATQRNILKANDFIRSFSAMGGTHMEGALKMALSMDHRQKTNHMVVLITDGRPTIGTTDQKALIKMVQKNHLESIRIFPLGIGDDINTHLLDQMSLLTRSFRTYISLNEDIEIKISNFYTKVMSPILSDISLSFSPSITVDEVYPKMLSDIFLGSSLTILGRYDGHGQAKVTLKGYLKQTLKKYTYPLYFEKRSDQYDFIPPLWAARQIGYLLDQIRLNGESKEIIDEIVHLSKKFGIVTPYTSYLILEDEINIPDSEDRILRNMAPESKTYHDKIRRDYDGIHKKSGRGSVAASKNIQDLKHAFNMDQSTASTPLKKEKGTLIRFVNSRSFYLTPKGWVDSLIAEKASNKKIRIAFATAPYFKLLKSTPSLRHILALGPNIRFVFKSTIYEIYDR